MGVQKEDVEKFLQGNPAFAAQYFAKKVDPASIAKVSGLSDKQTDFTQFQELSQVSLNCFAACFERKVTAHKALYIKYIF